MSLLVFISFSSLVSAVDLKGLSLSELRIALKPDKNPEAMIEERKVLESFVSENTGKPARVIIPLSSAVIIEGFANGSLDIAYLASVDMVNAQKLGAAEILLAGEIDGRNFYESYWLSLRDKPYKAIEDLKGKRVAFSSRTSTSGYLVPHYDLIRRGLLKPLDRPEEFFGRGQVWYGTGYVSAVEQVLQGNAEAAAVSDYVYLRDKHLNSEQKARLKVVAKQGPVPTHMIVVRSGISQSDQKILRELFKKKNEPAHQNLRDRLFTSKLVEVEPKEHLASIQDALEKTGITR